MLKHLVFFRLKDEALGMDKAENARAMAQKLRALVGVIPEIRLFEVGHNILPGDQAADLVLVSAFDDLEALTRYANHPAHLEVVAFIKQVICERRVVDYLDSSN